MITIHIKQIKEASKMLYDFKQFNYCMCVIFVCFLFYRERERLSKAALGGLKK